MADQKVERDLPAELQIFLASQDVDISILPVPEKHAIQEIYRVSSLNKFTFLCNHLLFQFFSLFSFLLIFFINLVHFLFLFFFFLATFCQILADEGSC